MASLSKSISNALDRWSIGRLTRNNAFVESLGRTPFRTGQYWDSKPKWVSLSAPEHFEAAARFNPIVKATINLLSTSASNGRKVLLDSKTGEPIEWTENDAAVQKIKRLLVDRPNPLQSGKEFDFQGMFYLKVFGNRYVYSLMPAGFDKKLDLMNIEALYNLPSQFMSVNTTGKLYSQNSIEGIISNHARTNANPVESYRPEEIIHFNEVNISSEMATIMGISKLEALQQPVSNIQYAFEAMNTILTSRGAQGIISIDSRDQQGTIVPLNPNLKKDTNDKFKNDYGLLNSQNPFLLSEVPLNYIRTIMSSSELGIYEEFSNNSILVNNEYGVPPELVKTYIQGATYENQLQSVRRLYQDTTIPAVEANDQYMTYRLNTEQYGFRINTEWDHIPALQTAYKERATALNMKGKTAKDAYIDNIITWNQYLDMIEQPTVEGGDVYRYERNNLNGDEGN
jgi:phage portal protein BeeE